MLRSVFGKFQTVFKQTVTSSRKICSRYPRLLPLPVIIGITTTAGVASYSLEKLKPSFDLKVFDYKKTFLPQPLVRYSLNKLDDLLEKHVFEPMIEEENDHENEFSSKSLFLIWQKNLRKRLFDRVFEVKELDDDGVLLPPLFQWQYAWQMVKTVADTVEQTSPAVVRIVNIRRPPSESSRGCGFLVDKRGIILTIGHLVEDHKQIFVATADDEVYHGDVLSCDKKHDLAVIKIRGATKEFTTITLGDSDKINLNDSVIAIGSLKGFTNCVMSGVVTTFSDDGILFAIETDIPSYPGASGAPVINQNGEAIGIVWGGRDYYWFNKWAGKPRNPPLSYTHAIPSNGAKMVLIEAKNQEREQNLQATS